MIGIVFPMAEYLLVIMTIIYMHNEIDIKSYKLSIVKEFYHFGLQAMPIGLIAEINTRIDILCLNLFLSDSIVGLYSFALLFAEGIYQIYIVIRQVINPYIAEYRQQYGYKYKDFLKQLITINYAIAFLGGIIASYIYIWGTNNIFTKYIRSNDIFIILLVGIIINSYFIILSNYFVQSKKPLIESNISLIVVVSNVILDLSLIPSFGLEGAAIATSISYCIASLMQVFYANKLKI